MPTPTGDTTRGGTPAADTSADALPPPCGHLLDMARTIIANVGAGDWDAQTREWRAAASRWNEGYQRLLSAPGAEHDLVRHARQELALRGEHEQSFVASIVAAVHALCSHPHSGYSFPLAVDYLHRLLRHETLTPITDDPQEWIDQSGPSGYPLWQNRRDPRAMSYDGGKTYWLTTEAEHGHPLAFHASAPATSLQRPDETHRDDD